MTIDQLVADACSDVPQLLRCALVLLPDGLILGGTGSDDDFLAQEVLARSVKRCVEAARTPCRPGGPPGHFVEYAFVCDDELVIVQLGRRRARLAFALACRRSTNLALALTSTRRSIGLLEHSVDSSLWEQ